MLPDNLIYKLSLLKSQNYSNSKDKYNLLELNLKSSGITLLEK